MHVIHEKTAVDSETRGKFSLIAKDKEIYLVRGDFSK